MNFHPDKPAFLKRAGKGFSHVPVWCEIRGDLLTPVSAYFSLRSKTPFSFILESVNQNEKLGRYSMVGFDPLFRFLVDRESLTIFGGNGEILREPRRLPLKRVAEFMRKHRPCPDGEIEGFDGALIGYVGYNAVTDFEKIPDENPDNLNVPDIHLIVPSALIVFDHLKQTAKIILLVDAKEASAYDQARAKLGSLVETLFAEPELPRPILLPPSRSPVPEDYESNMTREEFMEIVKKAKDYVFEGDVFQVVLSQRFKMRFGRDPLEIYRALRSNNPSPYHYHLRFDGYSLSGSSPEVLVKKKGRELTLRPIAGTRPRGKDAAEDERLRNELLADPKEIAEHMMLLDLGRNDLGRICDFHSVRVDERLCVENYSHVMHIVSNVVGKANGDLDLHDALRAVFPAGTLSGAPKVRAMEIIDELETVRRGTYAGSVLKADFHGNLDACITIRSVLVKEPFAYIQAGAGIVADSSPEKEYEESLAKAMAVMKAVLQCREGK